MPRSYYFLIIILIPSLVYAQHHTSKTSINRQLFVGTVITNQESHTQWIQDIRTAFDQVLIRLSGNKNISSLPQMQQASLNIESYLLDYRYLRPKSGLRLEARFRTQSTLDLLRKSNQPIWIDRSAANILWITLDKDSKNQLRFDTEQQDQLVNDIGASAGLNINTVLDDLHWQHTMNQIKSIPCESKMLLHQLVLRSQSKKHFNYFAIACIQPNTDRSTNPVYASVSLWHQNTLISKWSIDSKSHSEAVRTGLENMVDFLFEHNSSLQDSNMSQSFNVLWTGLTDFKHYTELLTYLHHISFIKNYRIVTSFKNALVTHIHADGGLAALKTLAQHSNVLRIQSDDDSELANQDIDLRLQWLH